MVTLLQTYGKEFFAVAMVLFSFGLHRIFRLRPKILYSVKHSSDYPINEPLLDQDGNVVLHNQIVRTASIIAGNNGLQPAKNVEFTFNWQPKIFTFYPGRKIKTETDEFGRWSIQLESLAPNETFSIEILSVNADLPLLSSMRSDEAEGKHVLMQPQRVYPVWVIRSLGALLLLGIGTTIYLIALAIELLAMV